MSKHKLSREEEIRIFEDRCRCESMQPETEEQKQRAKENLKSFIEKDTKIQLIINTIHSSE